MGCGSVKPKAKNKLEENKDEKMKDQKKKQNLP